jgi:hypothetical protein
MTKCAIKNLNPGDRFGYGMKSAIVLDKMDDGVLCMVVDENYQCRFDEKKRSNFAESTLRTELNSRYMRQWIDAGANPRDFVKMEVDLTADDGLDDYGTCKCYLAPRTCDQHRKYRKLISICDGWEWTATPYSTKSNGDFQIVRVVYADGSLGYYYACHSGWVRPLFKLKPDTKVEVDTTNGVEECCLVDTMRKLVDEHGFPVVMETLAKVIVG